MDHQSSPYDHTSSTNNRAVAEADDEEAIVHASLMTSSFILPMVLNATVELGIFDILNEQEGQLSAYEITTHLTERVNKRNTQAAAASVLDRMLRLLASHSLLNCSSRTRGDEGSVQRVYGLAPAGKLFLRNEESLAGFLSFSHDQAILDTRYNVWSLTI